MFMNILVDSDCCYELPNAFTNTPIIWSYLHLRCWYQNPFCTCMGREVHDYVVVCPWELKQMPKFNYPFHRHAIDISFCCSWCLSDYELMHWNKNSVFAAFQANMKTTAPPSTSLTSIPSTRVVNPTIAGSLKVTYRYQSLIRSLKLLLTR